MLTLQNDNRSMTPFVVIALESDWRSFLRVFLTLDGSSLDTRLVIQGGKLILRSKCAQAELEVEGWKEEEADLRLVLKGELEGEVRLATDLSSGEVNLMRKGLVFLHLNLRETEAGKAGHKLDYKTSQGSGDWSYQLNREEEKIQFEAVWVKETSKFASFNLNLNHNVSLHKMLASATMDVWLSEHSWVQRLLGFHTISSWTSVGLDNSWTEQNRTLVSVEQVVRVDGQTEPVASIMFNSSSSFGMVLRGGGRSRQELNLVWTLRPCGGRWREWTCLSNFGGYLNIFKGDTRIIQFGVKSLWAGGGLKLGLDVLGPEKRVLVHMGVSLPSPALPNLDKPEISVLSNLPGLEEVFQVTGDGEGHWELHRGGELVASAQLQTLGNATVLMKLPHNESLELVAAVDSGSINLLVNFTSEWESRELSGRLRQSGSRGWSLVIEGTNPQFGDFSLARCLHLEQNMMWLCGEDRASQGPFSLLSPFLSLVRVAWAPEVGLTAWAGSGGAGGGPEWGFEGGKSGLTIFKPPQRDLNIWDRKARCSG